MKRETVKQAYVDDATSGILASLNRSREKHGTHEYASVHETLGIVAEEYYELIEAIKNGSREGIISELEDIAVGCLWGIASLKQQMHGTRPIHSTDGDVMSIAEFREGVEESVFTDYDGYGKLMVGDDLVDHSTRIVPSNIWVLDWIPSRYTHIMWYNR